jgi:ribosome-associated heat shock protein Hsp15
MTADSTDRVRTDKWLWAARLFKTRSLAGTACDAGHVKVNGISVKPARPLRCGDRLEVLTPGGERIVEVLALAERRGPAAQARLLYDDKTPTPPPRESPGVTRERGTGRPTKKDRRELGRLRGR